MRPIARFLGTAVLAAILLETAPPPARARLEEVLVTHGGTDDAVVERATGERWWLDVRQDCLGIRDCVGRTVLLWSPAAGITTESRLLVPERGLSCPIWQADTLDRAAPPRYSGDPPGAAVRALRQALETLDYDCGRPSPSWTPETALAFQRFREARRLDASPRGLRRAVISLALEVIRGRPAIAASPRLARILSDQLDPLVAYLSRPVGAGARWEPPTWIRAVAEDGACVTLGDGTRWQPAAEPRARVTRWRDGDEVVACSGRLVNGRTGEMVWATRLE